MHCFLVNHMLSITPMKFEEQIEIDPEEDVKILCLIKIRSSRASFLQPVIVWNKQHDSISVHRGIEQRYIWYSVFLYLYIASILSFKGWGFPSGTAFNDTLCKFFKRDKAIKCLLEWQPYSYYTMVFQNKTIALGKHLCTSRSKILWPRGKKRKKPTRLQVIQAKNKHLVSKIEFYKKDKWIQVSWYEKTFRVCFLGVLGKSYLVMALDAMTVNWFVHTKRKHNQCHQMSMKHSTAIWTNCICKFMQMTFHRWHLHSFKCITS